MRPAIPASDPVPAWSGESVSRALAQGLDTPLAALRATLESLSHELRSELPPLRVEGLLDEFDRLGRNVRELCELAATPVPRPLACSLDEIVRAARAQLRPEQRSRLVLARCEPGAGLVVDGPLLSTALRRLIENALEASESLVLVVARREQDVVQFAVIDDAPNGPVAEWRPAPFRTTKPNHLGLGLALTQRDVDLLGGRLEFLSTPGGETCVRITIPSKEDVR